MKIIIKIRNNQANTIKNRLKKIKALHNIIINDNKKSIICDHEDIYVHELLKLRKLQNTIKRLSRDITYVDIYGIKNARIPNRSQPHLRKKYYFFVDVDETFTEGKDKMIDTKAFAIFRKMEKEFLHQIIITSGRARTRIAEHIREADTCKIGIAENGGVVINADSNTGDKHLSKLATCKTVFNELQSKFGLQEKSADMRESEIIIEPKGVDIEKVRAYIKQRNLDAKLTDSTTSIHMTSGDTDKGKAVKFVREKFTIDREESISIGDSPLDIPMFKATGFGIAVANASKKVQSAADETTQKPYLDGVVEAFSWFEPRIK